MFSRLVKLAHPKFHTITPPGARRAPRPGVSGEPRGLGPIYVRAVPDKLYFANGSGCCTAAMRWRMMLQYSGSRSMPMHVVLPTRETAAGGRCGARGRAEWEEGGILLRARKGRRGLGPPRRCVRMRPSGKSEPAAPSGTVAGAAGKLKAPVFSRGISTRLLS